MIKGVKTLISCTTLAFALLILGMSEGQAVSGAEISKLLGNFATMGEKVCEKGNIFSTKITVRSFGGVLCGNKIIAALATLKCGGKGDFDESGCGKRAEKVMGDQTPLQVLGHSVKSGGSKAHGLICKLQGKIKPLQKICGHHPAAIEAGDDEGGDEGGDEDE
ncbi:MAG TPA: hypothetical protein VNJ29_03185 [Candidatus Nitrosotenuis sp.]|jgi:hypothetical protein|nr:hypothetical protein [Candidatus Nitrosotenuis sp.]